MLVLYYLLFLATKKAKILYIKDENLINTLSLDDLKKSCYFVNKVSLFEKLLIQFKKGGLESKFNTKIVDKYIYPINNGNPSLNVSSFINSIVK